MLKKKLGALVVDDEGSVRETLREFLLPKNFHVVVATTYSDSSLPTVLITVLDPTTVCSGPLTTVDAPEPPTSSEPFDIDPENPSGGYL